MNQAMRMQVPCVGGQHHAHQAAIDAGMLVVGTPVELRREPENPYDSNAIRVMVPATDELPELMIGYVRKNFAVDLAHHMDKGMKVTGTVSLVRATSCMINVEEIVDGQEKTA